MVLVSHGGRGVWLKDFHTQMWTSLWQVRYQSCLIYSLGNVHCQWAILGSMRCCHCRSKMLCLLIFLLFCNQKVTWSKIPILATDFLTAPQIFVAGTTCAAIAVGCCMMIDVHWYIQTLNGYLRTNLRMHAGRMQSILSLLLYA